MSAWDDPTVKDLFSSDPTAAPTPGSKVAPSDTYQNAFRYGGFDGAAQIDRNRFVGNAAGAQNYADVVRDRGGPQVNYGQADQDRSAGQAYGQQAGASIGQQQHASDLARQAAEGTAPSAAELLMRRGNDEAMQNSLRMAAGARGPAALAGAQSNALDANAMQSQRSVNDIGAMRAQEMAQARGQYIGASQNVYASQANQRAQELQQQGLDAQQAQYQANLEMEQRRLNDTTYMGLGQQAQGWERLGYDVNQAQLSANEAMYGQRNQAGMNEAQLAQQRSEQSDRNYWNTVGAVTGGVSGGMSGLATQNSSDIRGKRDIADAGTSANVAKIGSALGSQMRLAYGAPSPLNAAVARSGGTPAALQPLSYDSQAGIYRGDPYGGGTGALAPAAADTIVVPEMTITSDKAAKEAAYSAGIAAGAEAASRAGRPVASVAAAPGEGGISAAPAGGATPAEYVIDGTRSHVYGKPMTERVMRPARQVVIADSSPAPAAAPPQTGYVADPGEQPSHVTVYEAPLRAQPMRATPGIAPQPAPMAASIRAGGRKHRSPDDYGPYYLSDAEERDLWQERAEPIDYNYITRPTPLNIAAARETGVISPATEDYMRREGMWPGDAKVDAIYPREPVAHPGRFMSDERGKSGLGHGKGGDADAFLDQLHPYTYRYKDPSNEPSEQPNGGRYLGVMAQDVERSPTGTQIVKDTPRGKVLEGGAMLSAIAAGTGRLHERLSQLEQRVYHYGGGKGGR